MARHREFDTTDAMDRAMEVFWRRGYAGAPIQELCGAMNLNPGSVYAAFGSKHGLFLAVLKRYLQMTSRLGMERIRSNPSGADGIRDYFSFIADGISEGNRSWGCLGTNAFIEMQETDADVRAIMVDHLETLETAFREALMKDGIAEPEERAKYLLCFAQGLNVVAKTSLDSVSVRGTIRAALETLKAPSIAAE